MDIIETLLEEAFDTILNSTDTVQREYHFSKASNIIKVLIGMRRTGKTTFLYQTIQHLLDKGIEQSQILVINFEDDRLLPMDAKEMGRLIDSFYTLYPQNHERECYLFFDEVQNISDWYLVVRRFFDSKRVQIYLTGSSAKLLSKEINTSLRGRSLATEIFPYSFTEYLNAHHIPKMKRPFGKKALDVMQSHLFAYFEKGGFPAIQKMTNEEWRATLQTYVDTVILRDIIERHKITNITLLKYLTHTLLKNAATLFSVNKFFNDIKSQGIKVSKDTIHHYIEYIEDAFLIFTVSFYSESEREMRNVPKKIYVIDSGLIKAASLGTNDLYNKFFENLVYLDLRRKGKKIYYYKTKENYEIDFVTVDHAGERELIQVSVNIDDPKTAEREKRALDKAEKELGISGRIITLVDYLRDF